MSLEATKLTMTTAMMVTTTATAMMVTTTATTTTATTMTMVTMVTTKAVSVDHKQGPGGNGIKME